MDVVSDRGPQFVSKFWREFCHLLGATLSLSSGFHPQSNGQTERANQDLERMLRCLDSQNPSSWSQQLSWVEHAHNSLPVSATGRVWNPKSRSPLPTLLSRGAIAPGAGLDRPCSRWGRAPRLRPIATGLSLPSTSLVEKCGFQLRIFLSGPSVISLLPNLLAHLLSPRLLVRWQSASNFLRRTGQFIRCFMYPN